MRQLELRIPPLLLLAIFAAAVLVADRYLPLVRIPLPARGAVSALLIIGGVAIVVLAVIQFRRARTTVSPVSPASATAVVSGGVYRFSRNPMYLGFAVVLLGIAARGSALTGYLLVIAFCAYLTRFQIVPEERALLARFGAEFARYQSSVRRWF